MREKLLKFSRFADTTTCCIICALIGFIGIGVGVYTGDVWSAFIASSIFAYYCVRLIHITKENAKTGDETEAGILMGRLKGEPVVGDAHVLFMFIRDNNQCPDCRASPVRFLEGPSGGLSTNIQCMYCEAWFNSSPGVEMLERIDR